MATTVCGRSTTTPSSSMSTFSEEAVHVAHGLGVVLGVRVAPDEVLDEARRPRARASRRRRPCRRSGSCGRSARAAPGRRPPPAGTSAAAARPRRARGRAAIPRGLAVEQHARDAWCGRRRSASTGPWDGRRAARPRRTTRRARPSGRRSGPPGSPRPARGTSRPRGTTRSPIVSECQASSPRARFALARSASRSVRTSPGGKW